MLARVDQFLVLRMDPEESERRQDRQRHGQTLDELEGLAHAPLKHSRGGDADIGPDRRECAGRECGRDVSAQFGVRRSIKLGQHRRGRQRSARARSLDVASHGTASMGRSDRERLGIEQDG